MIPEKILYVHGLFSWLFCSFQSSSHQILTNDSLKIVLLLSFLSNKLYQE